MNPRRLHVRSFARSLLLSFLVSATVTAAGAQQAARLKPFDVANLDTTCAPCKDFFQFANGGWLKNNPVPAAYSSWGSFHELDERNRATLHTILDDDAATKAPPARRATRPEDPR